MSLLDKLAEDIDDLERSGRRVRVFRRHYPYWVQAVLAIQTNSWSGSTTAATDFSVTTMDVLEQLADVLDHRSAPLHPDAVAAMNTLLGEVLTATDADDSLDTRLKVHIRKVVRHLQTCVDEYGAYGESAALDALDAVWVAMGAAAHSSGSPGRWEKFRERFFFPTAAGLLANTPSLVLQIAGGGA